MHTCNCMFCYYRNLRIAAFGAVDRAAPAQQDDGGAAPSSQVTSPSVPSPSVDADSAVLHALQS